MPPVKLLGLFKMSVPLPIFDNTPAPVIGPLIVVVPEPPKVSVKPDVFIELETVKRLPELLSHCCEFVRASGAFINSGPALASISMAGTALDVVPLSVRVAAPPIVNEPLPVSHISATPVETFTLGEI